MFFIDSPPTHTHNHLKTAVKNPTNVSYFFSKNVNISVKKIIKKKLKASVE